MNTHCSTGTAQMTACAAISVARPDSPTLGEFPGVVLLGPRELAEREYRQEEAETEAYFNNEFRARRDEVAIIRPAFQTRVSGLSVVESHDPAVETVETVDREPDWPLRPQSESTAPASSSWSTSDDAPYMTRRATDSALDSQHASFQQSHQQSSNRITPIRADSAFASTPSWSAFGDDEHVNYAASILPWELRLRQPISPARSIRADKALASTPSSSRADDNAPLSDPPLRPSLHSRPTREFAEFLPAQSVSTWAEDESPRGWNYRPAQAFAKMAWERVVKVVKGDRQH